jgi:hypothetical protein
MRKGFAAKAAGAVASLTGLSSAAGGLGNGNPFAGQVDDVRIYNRALSAQEIKRLYIIGNIN